MQYPGLYHLLRFFNAFYGHDLAFLLLCSSRVDDTPHSLADFGMERSVLDIERTEKWSLESRCLNGFGRREAVDQTQSRDVAVPHSMFAMQEKDLQS